MEAFCKFTGFLAEATLVIGARDIGAGLTAPIRDHQAHVADRRDEALETVNAEVAVGIGMLCRRLTAGIGIIGIDHVIRRLNEAAAYEDHPRNRQMFR